jgi:hypothetical protein
MGATPDYLYFGIYEAPSTALASGIRAWYHAYPTAVSDSSPSAEMTRSTASIV